VQHGVLDAPMYWSIGIQYSLRSSTIVSSLSGQQ